MSGRNLPPSGTSIQAADPAWFWLGRDGLIRASTSAAAVLGVTDAAALVGTPLVSHLAWDITSQEPNWQLAQWEVLLAAASDQDLKVAPQSAPETELVLRLRPGTGPDGGYFATLAPTPPRTLPEGSDPLASWLESDAPAGLFSLHFQQGKSRFSASLKRLFGYADHELPETYEAWQGLLHPEDSAASPHRVSKRPPAPGTRPLFLEFRMRHRDGRYLWMQCLGQQVFGPSGDLVQTHGVLFDITERKELEEESVAAADRLRRISEHGQLGLFDLDFGAQQYWFSDTWRRLLGVPDAPSEPESDPLAPLLDALLPGRAPAGISTWLTQYRPDEEPLVEATTLLHRNGQVIPVLFGVARQFTRRRDLARVVGFALPLCGDAERMRSGSALPPPHLVGALLDALQEAIIVADAEGTVVYMNRRAERLTGRSPRTDGVLTISQAFPLVRRLDYQADHDAVSLHLASPEARRLRTEHALAPLPDRSEPLPILWSAHQSWDSEGRIAGAIIVFRDPREMSLTPEELLRANRLESLGQLAGGIAADYTNLLTTILGAISQAKENRDFSHLANAEKACLEATTLSRQLIAFATETPGARRAQGQVDDLLRDAVRIAATGCLASIGIDVPDHLPPVEVDRGQMLQVFQNLVLNAIQALPKDVGAGRIRLQARAVTLAEGEVPPLAVGRYVQIDVQDNGCGIAPENLERIFTPFYTTKSHGTGLGLATVLSIVRRHGGQVWVSSLPDAGSTFTVYLPAAATPTEPVAPRLPSLPFGTGRVLFMDDDPHISALTASMLQSLDYTFDLARDGEEALSLYRRYLNVGRPYDAVIMDLTVIGGMGGEECLRRLRELHPEVRALVSTGYDDPVRRRHFADIGFSGFLAKPYRVGDLGNALKAVIGDRSPPFSPPS